MSQYLRWWNLREAYRSVFRRGERYPRMTKAVLDDLKEFCRADSTSIVVAKDGHIDTHATAVCEGRREVYLRIIATLNLSDEDLQRMKELENE